MKRTDKTLRSLMFVPGHNEKLMESASRSKADAIIFDLEDSVMPRKNKEIARALVRRKIEDGLFDGFHKFPRINDRESGLLLKDIHALTIPQVDGFVCPKVQRGSDIHFIDKLLEAIEYEKGYPVGQFEIIPLIETASAVYSVREICEASDRVIAIAFGCEDYISDMEGIHDPNNWTLSFPRALIAMAARATGVIPIDTVHIDVHDFRGLEYHVKEARNLGFEGQLVLHPKELDIVHEIYTPSDKEVKDAEEMLRLFDEAQEKDAGVAVKGGKFIGPPMVVAAKKTIERSRRVLNEN